MLDSGVRIDPVIRSHSGSRICVVILEYPSWLQAVPLVLLPGRLGLLGGLSGHRSSTRKSISTAHGFCVGRGRWPLRLGGSNTAKSLMTSDEAAALVSRCYQAEWSAAVAHYNVAQLHQRLNQLEAAVAENIPPLPLPGVADSSAGAGAA